MAEKLSRNAPCPCGSGKKYKHCCIRKDFEWVEMDDGTIGRSVELSDDVRESLEKLREHQRRAFGREPEGAFEGAPPFEHIEHWTVEAMKKGNVDPALIYAYEKTNGLLLNHHNENKLPDCEIAEWEAAIDEYEIRTGTKAARRRLTDEDFDAIMQNGPVDRPQPGFVMRLSLPPPFTKEEWGQRQVSDIIEDQKCFDYLQSCIQEISRSGRGKLYLNMFLTMANLGGPASGRSDYEEVLKEATERDFSVDELNHTLESLFLTCKPKSSMPSAAAAFEVLGFIGDFMNSYAEHLDDGDELSDVLQKINGLALLAFIAAVNTELGIQPNTWSG
ncbi:MAG TPA: SEC-C domain-containing protein [Pirellulales bacterium]|nr:SEC-C domain-containing protein [Pirellulales bacterium]